MWLLWWKFLKKSGCYVWIFQKQMWSLWLIIPEKRDHYGWKLSLSRRYAWRPGVFRSLLNWNTCNQSKCRSPNIHKMNSSKALHKINQKKVWWSDTVINHSGDRQVSELRPACKWKHNVTRLNNACGRLGKHENAGWPETTELPGYRPQKTLNFMQQNRNSCKPRLSESKGFFPTYEITKNWRWPRSRGVRDDQIPHGEKYAMLQ